MRLVALTLGRAEGGQRSGCLCVCVTLVGRVGVMGTEECVCGCGRVCCGRPSAQTSTPCLSVGGRGRRVVPETGVEEYWSPAVLPR